MTSHELYGGFIIDESFKNLVLKMPKETTSWCNSLTMSIEDVLQGFLKIPPSCGFSVRRY